MLKLVNAPMQNFSVQQKTATALNQGIEDVHEIVCEHKEDLSSKKFFNEVKNYFFSGQRKYFFSRKVSNKIFLKDNKELFEGVLNYAIVKHKHEFRDSGYPYLAHVLSAGFVLARLGLPQEVVNAGILHDSVEHSLNKNQVLNDLYKLSPASCFYVFSVSAPDIQDAVERDKCLYDKINFYSQSSNNLFPRVIKCIDSIVNLYDVQDMSAKDGRSAKSRQLRFLATSRAKILPFAKEIDSEGVIPIKKSGGVFSLEDYAREIIGDKLDLISYR